jgi:hypothetical protein
VAPGELFGLILTEGFAYKSNIVPTAIAVLTGLRSGIVGLGKKQDRSSTGPSQVSCGG